MHQVVAAEGSESASDSEKNSSASDNENESNSSSGGSGSDSDSGSSSSSSKSASGSGSESDGSHGNNHKSRSSTQKSSPDKSSAEKVQPSSRPRDRTDIKQCWEENPDVYGIRRSGRSRKEPERLRVNESDSGEKVRSKRGSRQSSRNEWNSESGSESDDSFGERAPPSKSVQRNRNIQSRRPVGKVNLSRSHALTRHDDKRKPRRRRGSDSSDESSLDSENGATNRLYSNAYYDDVYRQTSLRSSRSVTYKEASDDETGSEDLVEVDEEEVATAAAMEPDNSETIERVLAVRREIGRAHV